MLLRLKFYIILLTKREGPIGRILIIALESTDRAQRDLTYGIRHGPEQAWLVRNLLQAFVFEKELQKTFQCPMLKNELDW